MIKMVWRKKIEGVKYYTKEVETRGQAEGLRIKLKNEGYQVVKTQKLATGKTLIMWRNKERRGKING